MQNDIKQALQVLRNGGVILYPTDTIWGLGCDATNKEAVKKIYEIKKRTDNKSLIVLMDSVNRLGSYVDDIPDVVYDMLEFSENPLTLILEGAKYLADNVINSEDNSVGIRIISEPFCNKLIQQFRKPIVSTSANISGQKTPTIFDEISEEIISAVDYVVKYRQEDTNKAKPSKIIKLSKSGQFKLIR
jgi:L-threonylcarbamoyladenylate synthase